MHSGVSTETPRRAVFNEWRDLNDSSPRKRGCCLNLFSLRNKRKKSVRFLDSISPGLASSTNATPTSRRGIKLTLRKSLSTVSYYTAIPRRGLSKVSFYTAISTINRTKSLKEVGSVICVCRYPQHTNYNPWFPLICGKWSSLAEFCAFRTRNQQRFV